MVLHLGEDAAIPVDRLIMVINALNMTPEMAAYVERCKRERHFSNCRGRIKSYALVRERGKDRLYASMISTSTLMKRLEDAVTRRSLFEAAVVSAE